MLMRKAGSARAGGTPWRAALPPGYGLSLVGVALFLVGGGFDFFFSEFFSVTLNGEMVMSNTDRFDGIAGGSSKTDSYLRGGIEFRYYFFDKAFMSRMLEALKARYE